MQYGSAKVREGVLFALLLVGVLVFVTPQVAWADTVATADSAEELTSAIEEANGSTTINLGANIQLQDTLQIAAGKNITLTGEHSITFSSDRSYETFGKGSVAVYVAEGGSLTLGKGVTLNGDGCGAATALYSNGTVTLDGGTIANFKSSLGNRSLILSEGSSASFIITSGSINNNDSSARHPGGVLEVSKGAKLVMSGGEISENRANEEADMAGIVIVGISQYANLGDKTNSDLAGVFEFTGGVISHNSAATTVYVGEANAALGPEYHSYEVAFDNVASLTMSKGAEISGNVGARFGGGVGVWGPGRFTMEGGNISGNTSPLGAGVAAVDTYSMGDLEHRVVRSDSQYGEISLDEWSKVCPAAFTMEGGTISGNQAESSDGEPVGAGVYVSSNEVHLKSGTISGNTAVSDEGSQGGQGGGVYVSALPYTLRLQNALVTDNTATELGGGLWLCPMGGAESHVKNGGAILGNTSKGAGDDVVSLAKDREGYDTGSSLTLLDRLLGNHQVDWYQDGAVDKAAGVLGTADKDADRYPTLKNRLGGVIEKHTEDIALKAVTTNDADALDAAKSQAKLLITGNTAVRGGGIGSNGIVQFGDAPVVYPSVNVNVAKTWDDGKPADSHDAVSVILMQYDAEGNSHAVAHATLSKDNGWTYTFTQTDEEDLLAKYGAYGQDHAAAAIGRSLTRYAIVEDTPQGYQSVAAAFTHQIEVKTTSGHTPTIESALDGFQLTQANGKHVETFKQVDVPSQVMSDDGSKTFTFIGLPNTNGDSGSQIPIDYRVALGDKTNESFLSISEKEGFNQLGDTASVSETLSTVLTNTATASLSITKEVEGGNAGDQQFSVQVSLKGDAGRNVDGMFQATWAKDGQTIRSAGIEFSRGVATFQLGQGQTVTIDGLPGGIEYDVNEVDIPSGYELVSVSGEDEWVTVAPGTEKITVTNRKVEQPTTPGDTPSEGVDSQDQHPQSGLPQTRDTSLPLGVVVAAAAVGLLGVVAGAVRLRRHR